MTKRTEWPLEVAHTAPSSRPPPTPPRYSNYPSDTNKSSLPTAKYTKDYKSPHFNLTTADPNNLMQIIREYETIISNKDNNLYEIRQQLRTLELDQTQVLITLR